MNEQKETAIFWAIRTTDDHNLELPDVDKLVSGEFPEHGRCLLLYTDYGEVRKETKRRHSGHFAHWHHILPIREHRNLLTILYHRQQAGDKSVAILSGGSTEFQTIASLMNKTEFRYFVEEAE